MNEPTTWPLKGGGPVSYAALLLALIALIFSVTGQAPAHPRKKGKTTVVVVA